MNWLGLTAEQLMRACATSEVGGAWEEFIRRYHSVITAAAIRVSRHWGNGTTEEVDDVVQEIYLKFCADRGRVVAGFQMNQQEEAIFGFIKVVATNTARDFFRKRSAGKRGVGVTGTLDELVTRVALPADMERQLTLGQLHDVLRINTQGEGSAARDRAIFQFYYRDGMTAQAISQLPGVDLTAKGVEGVLHRLTGILRKAVSSSEEMNAAIRSKKGGSVEA